MEKRLFSAIKISLQASVLQEVNKIKQDLYAEKIRWVNLENIHLTLKFFGNTPTHRMADISLIFEELAGGFTPFQLQLEGVGVFPSPQKPKVLWMGIKNPKKLITFAQKGSHLLQKIGYQAEKRKFSPHITLGRIKFVKNVNLYKSVLQKYQNMQFQTVEVSSFILYESILTPQGAIYKILEKYNLNH